MKDDIIDTTAEALADLRITVSTHPDIAQERNDMLDRAIIAVRDSITLDKLCGQLFCARAHYGRRCKQWITG